MEAFRPSKTGPKPVSGFDFDASAATCRTADADESGRMGCHAVGRLAGGCMKVQTQRDSLARIASGSTDALLELRPMPKRKEVKFHEVEIREYPRILGDNPSTSSGPPIGIGWRYRPEDAVVVDLDLYERRAEGTRRTKADLIIPADVRVDMLREVGYSRCEISGAVRTARKAKERRRSALNNPKFDSLLEGIETVKCGVKGMISRRRPSNNFTMPTNVNGPVADGCH
ncbi:hypothetical protein ACHAWF_013172 [Thalassiosira exigua]